MAKTPSPTGNAADPLPFSPQVLHILLTLANHDRHGYGIIKEVRRATDGRARLSTGTLYGAVQRLLDAGILAETEDRDTAINVWDPAVLYPDRYASSSISIMNSARARPFTSSQVPVGNCVV